MSTEANALNFLSLYLEPFTPGKNLDLLKLKLIKKARRKKTKDPGLAEVGLIREVISVLQKKRKSILSQLDPREIQEAVLVELLKLPPEDALLVCSSSVCPIPLQSLSLAMGAPISSLQFRKEQLESYFKELDLDLSHLEKLRGDRESGALPSRAGRRGPITTFQSLPLAARFLVETILVLSLLLALLWVIPEVRNRYEASIQARINEFLIESALLDSPAPEGTSKEPKSPLLTDAPAAQDEAITKSSSDAPSQKRQPKVTAGETWRFSFTGSATPEIESSILEILSQMQLEGQKPLNVPGGVQFDFVIETSRLLELKDRLESAITRIQGKAPSSQTSAIAYANMSWYKKQMMGNRKIPSGQVQVVIWISTL